MPDVEKRPPVKPVMPPNAQPSQEEMPKPKAAEPAADTVGKKLPERNE